MVEGVTQNVFPGAVLLVARGGEVVWHRAYGHAQVVDGRRLLNTTTRFDVASLTKALGTAVAAMLAVDDGLVDLDAPLGATLDLGSRPIGSVSARLLLAHASGLPAWRPIYRDVLETGPDAPVRRDAIRERIRIQTIETPLEYAPGDRSLYSDLGFIVLDWLLEVRFQRRLDGVLADRVFGPLDLHDTGYIDIDRPLPVKSAFAATERCGWRRRVLVGEVHDQNTYAMGGVSGQAGMFSTAQDLHRLAQALWRCWRGDGAWVTRDTIRGFWRRTDVPGTCFALGWDTPSDVGYSSAGRLLSRRAVGHLGFTGCSLWLDPDRGDWTILLTNRVHPSTDNRRIAGFRPFLHDLVFQELLR